MIRTDIDICYDEITEIQALAIVRPQKEAR